MATSRDLCVENEIGDEQLKAGSFVGKRTCWRKSSSAVDSTE